MILCAGYRQSCNSLSGDLGYRPQVTGARFEDANKVSGGLGWTDTRCCLLAGPELGLSGACGNVEVTGLRGHWWMPKSCTQGNTGRVVSSRIHEGAADGPEWLPALGYSRSNDPYTLNPEEPFNVAI